ncbi:hypothetical protein LJC45_02090 [Alistipes sp. OttesenSCG-928-B03]|nr:hypothetical protein [Alistipes sp. OttesenSCG-928-B03]
MKIFIDNQEVDTDARTNVSLTLAVGSHTELDVSKTGYTKSIVVPMTVRNTGIFGGGQEMNAVARFNCTEHTARIETDGCTVMEGVPMLAQSAGMAGGGYYRLNIIGAGKEWVKTAAATPLRSLGVEFGETVSATMIERSWTWDKPVRFLPVQRDGFRPENWEHSLFPPQKVLTYEDYHPFLHVKSVVERIFAAAGYRVDSEFFDSGFFASLYMSGNYPTRDVELVKSRMDFRAGRFAAASATADSMGRVYADPWRSVNSVGNIVETANPREERDGMTVAGGYSVGDYFRMEGGQMVFAPPTAVTMGFEYTLRFTTDYRIADRMTLAGFDRIYVGGEQEYSYTLANRNADRRGELRGDKTFKVFVFGHVAGAAYRLVWKEITNPDADAGDLRDGDYVMRSSPTFSARSYAVTFATANRIADPLLTVRGAGNDFAEYTEDWAMYDGYVEETGTVEVEAVVRSSPERILPSQPRRFDNVYFGGAAEGMSLKVSNLTTLKPYFVYHPAEGTHIDFQAVAAHSVSCLDVIKALKHMFNLWFLTDPLTRTVYVEPRDGFYRNDAVVDLAGRIDLQKPVAISEIGQDMPGLVTFGYAAGDAAVAAINMSEGGRLGSWSARLSNLFARQETRTYQNPMFAPSASETGAYSNAPSATLLRVGDAATDGQLNFAPRIVRYLGMAQLPAGETWGWPSHGGEYPFLAFHYKGADNPYSGEESNPESTFADDPQTLIRNGLSLCFEDRDGVAGIHRFYDSSVGLWNNGKRIEARVAMRPEEIEAIASPNRLGRDFRALYRLEIDGESALCRLEEVTDYNPAGREATGCVFVKEI